MTCRRNAGPVVSLCLARERSRPTISTFVVVEARVDGRCVLERAGEEPGDDDEQHGAGHLRRDEHLAQPEPSEAGLAIALSASRRDPASTPGAPGRDRSRGRSEPVTTRPNRTIRESSGSESVSGIGMFGSSARRRPVIQRAASRPAAPPSRKTASDSTTSWRTSRAREAPSASRTAVSRRRAAARASIMPAMLIDATTRTRPTIAPRIAMNAPTYVLASPGIGRRPHHLPAHLRGSCPDTSLPDASRSRRSRPAPARG